MFLKEIVVFMLNWRKKISVDAINYVFLRFVANVKKMFVIRIRKKYFFWCICKGYVLEGLRFLSETIFMQFGIDAM